MILPLNRAWYLIMCAEFVSWIVLYSNVAYDTPEPALFAATYIIKDGYVKEYEYFCIYRLGNKLLFHL